MPSETNSLLAKPADPAVIRSALEFLERDTMGETWQEALKAEFKKPYFLEVSSKIRPGALILKRIIVEGILDIRTSEAYDLPEQSVLCCRTLFVHVARLNTYSCS